MARSNLTDYLQVYPFWLTDVAPIEPLALPIFSPLSGFSAITAPEVTMETRPVEQANWFFPTPVIKSATNNTLTLSRGASWYDSDFYHWVMSSLTGSTGGQRLAIDSANPGPGGLGQAFQRGGPTPRRDLLLIQFLSRTPIPRNVSPALAAAASASLVLSVQGSSSAVAGGAAGLAGAGGVQGALGAVNVGFGLVEFAPRFPAKAWMLYGCIPTRYKVGGDFDAASSDVSIQELDVEYEYFDEITLSLP